MFGFPVPVSNQSIPRGWFAALVRFMNSLLLRGDGRYFAVTHTTEGTTIKPTPALIQALERSGGAAPSAGGGGTTYGIEATIDGSTASIALVEGGTASSLSLIPTAPVTLTAGANGELIIGSTASGGGGMMPPDYNHTLTIITSSSSTLVRTYSEGVWLIGSAQAQFGEHDNDDNSVVLSIGTVYVGYRVIDGSIAYGTTVPSPYNSITIGAAFCFFVPAGTPFYFTITGNAYVTCEVHSTLT